MWRWGTVSEVLVLMSVRSLTLTRTFTYGELHLHRGFEYPQYVSKGYYRPDMDSKSSENTKLSTNNIESRD